MSTVYIVGVGCTRFGHQPTLSVKELTKAAVTKALLDSGCIEGKDVETVYFGSYGVVGLGQYGLRGEVCLTPLVEEGLFRPGLQITNVEGGCGTGSIALRSAVFELLAGRADIGIAIGAEKMFFPGDRRKAMKLLAGGIDNIEPWRWKTIYEKLADEFGRKFVGDDNAGSLFMQTYSLQALRYMKKTGLRIEDLGLIAEKDYYYASNNPIAHRRNELSVGDVLNDRMIFEPLTRSMCAPLSDGAAAVLMVSEKKFKELPRTVRKRGVKIKACEWASGHYQRGVQHNVSFYASQKAYRISGIEPNEVCVAEVHDATVYAEPYQAEQLGFCDEGAGPRLVREGQTRKDGKIPINISGGLVARGHPVAASGLGMTHEIVLQLRGEAGIRQVPGATIGLVQNSGGVMGLDEAVCTVIILERAKGII